MAVFLFSALISKHVTRKHAASDYINIVNVFVGLISQTVRYHNYM
jgi:hypothetical protein